MHQRTRRGTTRCSCVWGRPRSLPSIRPTALRDVSNLRAATLTTSQEWFTRSAKCPVCTAEVRGSALIKNKSFDSMLEVWTSGRLLVCASVCVGVGTANQDGAKCGGVPLPDTVSGEGEGTQPVLCRSGACTSLACQLRLTAVAPDCCARLLRVRSAAAASHVRAYAAVFHRWYRGSHRTVVVVAVVAAAQATLARAMVTRRQP